jgi:hypothetical protein
LSQTHSTKLTQGAIAIFVILFGLLTIFAGTRVLLGFDPGYNVFQPLLIYNTLMGVVYIVTGIITWRNLIQGKRIAAAILILNLLMLGVISYLHISTNSIAVESLFAMGFRTTIWFGLLIGLVWVSKRKR